MAQFLKVYQSTGSIEKIPGSGRLSSVTWRIKELVEEQMNKDDETTATQLHQMLLEPDSDITAHYPQMQNSSWMDLQRQRLLSTHPGQEYSEALEMSSRAHY